MNTVSNKITPIDQAVILMAGKGTRFLPATKCVAKELFPIFDTPALVFHLQELYDSGIKRICLVISHEKETDVKRLITHDEKLEESLKASGKIKLLDQLNNLIDNLDITCIFQGEMIGTAGALYVTKFWTNNKPFALVFGDDICIAEGEQKPATKQLIEAYERSGGKAVVGAKKMPRDVIYKYSSIVTGEKLSDDSFEMKDIIEKPPKGTEPSDLVGMARYIVTPNMFPKIPELKPSKNGELILTEVFQDIAKQGDVVTCAFDADYYDGGNKPELFRCIIHQALKSEYADTAVKYMTDAIEQYKTHKK